MKTLIKNACPKPIWIFLVAVKQTLLNSVTRVRDALIDMSTSFFLIGLNLGAGKWRKMGWLPIDSRHFKKSGESGAHLDEFSKLTLKNESVRFVFSSNFFEHIDDATAINLVQESYRTLKPGGVLRITVPDFDRAHKNFLSGNHHFFDVHWGMAFRYENWRENGVEPTLENKLLYALASYDNMGDQGFFPPWKHLDGYYCGPPLVPQTVAHAAMTSMNTFQLSRWAVSFVPSDRLKESAGHINYWNLDRLKQVCTAAGFQECELSTYLGSSEKHLRQPCFDKMPEISLYFEARKPNNPQKR